MEAASPEPDCAGATHESPLQHHLRRFFVIAITLLLTACYTNFRPVADGDLSLTPTAVSTEEATPESSPPTMVPIPGLIGPEFPANVNPLTGLMVDDPSILDRRPMVVKISNAPPLVRPQAGISAADLVYEHYAEGGLTRFSAIFYGQTPTRVGSIRSARLIDYELVPMYDALLAYSGASNGVLNMLQNSGFWERTYVGVWYGMPYYWRDESIEVPHNLFLNPAALWDLASQEGLNHRPDLQNNLAFLEAPSLKSDGTASTIDIRYRATRVVWEYDPAIGRYRRSSDGLGHFDANTMEQVTADNVVIIYASHTLSNIAESEWQGNVTYGIEIQLWFEGDAVLFRDGRQYVGRWVRPAREQMLSLRTEDGQILPLKPGNTWFQVFPLPEQQDPAEESVIVS